MRCTVELFGVARLRARRQAIHVRFSEDTGECGDAGRGSPETLGDALTVVAAKCPELVGLVLSLDGRSLCVGYLVSRNGREFIDQADATIEDGDHLLLISSAVGGARG